MSVKNALLSICNEENWCKLDQVFQILHTVNVCEPCKHIIVYFLPQLNNTISYKKKIVAEMFQKFKNPAFAYSCSDNNPDFLDFADFFF